MKYSNCGKPLMAEFAAISNTRVVAI